MDGTPPKTPFNTAAARITGTSIGKPAPSASTAAMATANKTIVALARPDRSFFDRCVEILFRYTEESGLNLIFQPTMETATVDTILSLTQTPPFGFMVFGLKLAKLAGKLNEMGHRTVLVGAPPAGEVLSSTNC